MKKICIVTATRAEYGLLKPVMSAIRCNESLCLQILATGMHLSPEFGLTYKEIENDGFTIDEKVEIQMSSDTSVGIAKTMGLAMISLPECLNRLRPDIIILLGDRFETVAVATVATVMRIPIAHLYGGETTEGAFDEAFRHAITKMSYLHFTSTEEYRQRVIQLGEWPDRVFNVGSLGVENIKNIALLDKKTLQKELNFTFDSRVAVVTFHPVTLEQSTAKMQFQELLDAFNEFDDLKLIFTKANADIDGRIINQMIDQYVVEHTRKAVAYTSMGILKYLSSLKYVDLVIGNSSSGIIEAPSFGIPTINIGDRQKGRIKADSVIDCRPVKQEIIKVIRAALADTGEIKRTANPYEGSNTSGEIIDAIKNYLNCDSVNLKKEFYDLDFKL